MKVNLTMCNRTILFGSKTRRIDADNKLVHMKLLGFDREQGLLLIGGSEYVVSIIEPSNWMSGLFAFMCDVNDKDLIIRNSDGSVFSFDFVFDDGYRVWNKVEKETNTDGVEFMYC